MYDASLYHCCVQYLGAEIRQLSVDIRLNVLVKLSFSLKCNAINFQYWKFYYFLQKYNNINSNRNSTLKYACNPHEL